MKKNTIIICAVLLLSSCLTPVRKSEQFKGVDLSFIKPFDGRAADFSGEDKLDFTFLTDAQNNGNSSGHMYITNEDGNEFIGFRYELGAAYKYRYVELRADAVMPLNVAHFNALSFRIRGSGQGVRVKLKSANIKGYDLHGCSVMSTSSNWKKTVFPFSYFKQEGWGKAQKLDFTKIIRIIFQTSSQQTGDKGFIEIDDIAFINQSDDDIPLFAGPLADFSRDDKGYTLQITTDQPQGGASTAVKYFTNSPGGRAVGVRYELKKDYQYRYINLQLNTAAPINVEAYNSLAVKIRGNTGGLRCKLWSRNVSGYDWHGFVLEDIDKQWTEMLLPLSEFVQEGWGQR
ncbi:MAG TPA: CIA30 family protein, partial [Spirochaetota bacterium]|nr:CIA30 family protein [Spirochaetota bacterium]